MSKYMSNIFEQKILACAMQHAIPLLVHAEFNEEASMVCIVRGQQNFIVLLWELQH